MVFVLLTLKQPFFFFLLDLQIRIQDTKLIILRVFVISFLRYRKVLLKLVFFTYLWIFFIYLRFAIGRHVPSFDSNKLFWYFLEGLWHWYVFRKYKKNIDTYKLQLLCINPEILWDMYFFHELLMKKNTFYFMFQSNWCERNMK